jgi:hypothetical protein
MKCTFLILLLSSVVSSNSLFGIQANFATVDNPVPGNSPLGFCQADTSEYLLTIEKVDLTPNPPKPGQTLTVEAAGIFHERIEEGAYVHLQVKYNSLIRIINTKADLCEQIRNVDLECPIEKGEKIITKEIDLPKEVPPGTYEVLADVYDKDDKKITCLTAEVKFEIGGGSSFELK